MEYAKTSCQSFVKQVFGGVTIMIHSSRQLKDLIRNPIKEVGIEPYVLIRKYMMERFL